MGHIRTYSGQATVLIACSICPGRYEYPTEIRRCADRLFRCFKCDTGKDPVTYAKDEADFMRTLRDDANPRIPGAHDQDFDG